MKCNCSVNEILKSSSASRYKSDYLTKVKIDVSTWKGLYKCKICNQYWEESFDDGRFGGDILLKKVDSEYVKSNWKQKN